MNPRSFVYNSFCKPFVIFFRIGKYKLEKIFPFSWAIVRKTKADKHNGFFFFLRVSSIELLVEESKQGINEPKDIIRV